jgi:hypothetical protein
VNIRHRQESSWRKEVRAATGRQDRRFHVVTDTAIDRFDNIPVPKLADRADEIIRRLGLSERSPRQGSDQAQKKHRQTPHGIHLPVCTRFLSSSLAEEDHFSPNWPSIEDVTHALTTGAGQMLAVGGGVLFSSENQHDG